MIPVHSRARVYDRDIDVISGRTCDQANINDATSIGGSRNGILLDRGGLREALTQEVVHSIHYLIMANVAHPR
jgi:hypothetical protein